jgi:hypothetical protein
MAPGAFPAYSLLSAFGQAAPVNVEYQRANRVLPVPFKFLNAYQDMNVKPKHYSWPDFYHYVLDLSNSYSWRSIISRYRTIKVMIPRRMNVLRAVSSSGFGRIRYYEEVRQRLDVDRQFRRFFEQETRELPPFYVDRGRKGLGLLWEWLPEGALYHDPNAYLRSETEQSLNAYGHKTRTSSGTMP